MSPFDQQLHGYRHGHQLISGTITLPKADQDLVDRLSDVAGPLGPGERFAPYLTCYPLLSGSHYIIARTWQDLDAPRAGCVRTRSLLVPMADWMEIEDVTSIVEMVTRAGPERPADRLSFSLTGSAPPPLVDSSQGTELVEALFLEDRVPIVVFDAERPEAIALRLLTAFWPALRRNFSVSTFCRSPRMIARRSFDLVFAPKNARSRFSDWEGRRIDGRRRESARHPWSATIVDQVFRSSKPTFRNLDLLGEMSGDAEGSEAALRVSLLWGELHRKLDTSPNAVLGLLDIANTRATRNVKAIRDLEPALARAASRATTSMAPSDAWRFLGALAEKLGDLRLTLPVAKSIRLAAVELAAAHPAETVDSLPAFVREGKRQLLASGIGEGLARILDAEIVDRLRHFDGPELLNLMIVSPALAERGLSGFPALSTSIAEALKHADADVRDEARRHLLPLLVSDQHVEPARVLFADLDGSGLASEARHLYKANRLESEFIRTAIVDRAREANAVEEVRDAVASLGEEPGVVAMIASMVRPTIADLAWLLTTSHLAIERRLALILRIVRLATVGDLHSMLGDAQNLPATIDLLARDVAENADALFKLAANIEMEPIALVDLTMRLLPALKGRAATDLAKKALDAALPSDMAAAQSNLVDVLLSKTGGDLNGATALRVGLEHGVSSAIASRNLIAFNQASPAVRERILGGIEEMAIRIVGRGHLDLSLEAVEAAASLLWDSDHINHGAFLAASAILLPFLLNSRREPASPLIAAAFPPVYRELQRDSPPNFLSFIFIFVDWDKCKIARRQLVDASLGSHWRLADIGLAAARAGDAARILRHMAREKGGKRAIETIERDLEQIPMPWRQQVRSAIREIDRNESFLEN